MAGKRYFHAVFFCHLAVEKAIKGIIHDVSGNPPPKSHDLLYLLSLTPIKMPDQLLGYLSTINEVAVLSRYPADLIRMEETFTFEVSNTMIEQGKELSRWIVAEFKK
jgi:HEPN domain-containing protein